MLCHGSTIGLRATGNCATPVPRVSLHTAILDWFVFRQRFLPDPTTRGLQ